MHTDHPHTNDFLNSLDKIEKVKAPDFFQTRLMARLEKEMQLQQMPVWQRVLKPLPVLALVSCLVVLNLYTLGNIFFDEKGTAQPSEESITGFASEYNLYNSVDINN